jgi:predicted transposase/invertase (TIGR01784 family)
MRSDPIFYELFQVAPQTFFELIQVKPSCSYTFKSITVKTTEKRIDGILEPSQKGQPIYFIEVQGYEDEAIYCRTLREVFTFFEQNPDYRKSDWQAVVIWLNKDDDDPGFDKAVIYDKDKHQRLFSIDLVKTLKKLNQQSLVYNVLRPFIAKNETEVREHLSEWVTAIQQNDLGNETEQRLTMLLTQIIEQKFKRLSYKELEQMLRLTPFKETRSYRESLQEDVVGLLTKQIKRKFKFAESTMIRLQERLQRLTLKDLEELFEEIIDMVTLREINAWVSARTPRTVEESTSKD